MSDRELVTIDPKQLTALEMLLGNIASTLGDKLAHVERTLHTGLGAIAQGGGAGDNSQVLLAINGLTKSIEEKFMGLKEDFGTLTSKFDGLESATLAVADDIAALKQEIADANERANIDLSPLMARADNIEAGLRAAVGSQAGSDSTATPAEPPAEG